MRWCFARAKDGYLAETASYFSAHEADGVAVVEDGVISEFGSHDELVAAGGWHAALWHSWHGKA